MPNSIIRDFHKLYHESIDGTWHQTYWMGVKTLKCPLDLWIYQELLWRIKPDLVIETGSAFGGSALYLAHILALIGHGRVISIDIKPPPPVRHRLITFITGSSVAEKTLTLVKKHAAKAKKILVILDSDHHKQHVLNELNAYAPLVSNGSYLIVEDTDINQSVRFDHGPGPTEALREWLPNNSSFKVDRNCEKLLMTFNPGGYLKCSR